MKSLNYGLQIILLFLFTSNCVTVISEPPIASLKVVKEQIVDSGSAKITAINNTSHPEQLIIASERPDWKVKLVDLKPKVQIKTILSGSSWLGKIEKSSGDFQVMAVDKGAALFDATNHKLIKKIETDLQLVDQVFFNSVDNSLVVASRDPALSIWSLKPTLKKLNSFKLNNLSLALDVSPDGNLIAVSEGMYILILDRKSLKQMAVLHGHTMMITDVFFHPKHNVLLSTSFDKTIKFWNLNTYKEIKSILAHNSAIHKIAFSHDYRIAATVSTDNTLNIWDGNSFKKLLSLSSQKKKDLPSFNDVVFSSKGYQVRAAANDGHIYIWELAIENRP